MTRGEALARFCGACKKHVHDLTLLTEAEAVQLLGSRETESLCVRYAADDRGQLVFLPDVPTSRLTRKRRVALAAAALAATFGAGCAERMMMGDVAGPPGASAPARPKAYEITRATTRVSINEGAGQFVNSSAKGPDFAQASNQFVNGSCSGDEAGCKETMTLLAVSTSSTDFLERLQQAGFSVICQTSIETSH